MLIAKVISIFMSTKNFLNKKTKFVIYTVQNIIKFQG